MSYIIVGKVCFYVIREHTPIAALALGDTHIVALRRDGKILAWGKNDVGQCDVPVDLH